MNLLNSYLFLLSALSSYNIQTTEAFRVAFPEFRFTKTWEELTDKDLRRVKQLGYEELTWNYPEDDDVQSWDLEMLDFKNDRVFKRLAKYIGFDGKINTQEEMWDCWHDHYYSYSWEDLEKAK